MPHNDYTDPQLTFPRLEVRIVKTDGDAFHVQAWKWLRAGVREEKPILSGKKAGSFADVRELIVQLSAEYGIEIEPDDVDWPS